MEIGEYVDLRHREFEATVRRVVVAAVLPGREDGRGGIGGRGERQPTRSRATRPARRAACADGGATAMAVPVAAGSMSSCHFAYVKPACCSSGSVPTAPGVTIADGITWLVRSAASIERQLVGIRVRAVELREFPDRVVARQEHDAALLQRGDAVVVRRERAVGNSWSCALSIARALHRAACWTETRRRRISRGRICPTRSNSARCALPCVAETTRKSG